MFYIWIISWCLVSRLDVNLDLRNSKSAGLAQEILKSSRYEYYCIFLNINVLVSNTCVFVVNILVFVLNILVFVLNMTGYCPGSYLTSWKVWIQQPLIQQALESTISYSTTLGLNNPWIQKPLDSMILRFHNPCIPRPSDSTILGITLGCNDPWIPLFWIQRSLGLTIFNSTTLDSMQHFTQRTPSYLYWDKLLVLNIRSYHQSASWNNR